MSTHLPFDIQVQILVRLPVKSLIQFRSVCKVWKSFIDSSHFIAGYSFRHPQSQHLVIRQVVEHYDGDESEVKYVSFVDDDDDSFRQQMFALTVPHLVQGTVILGSSHGLLFLADSCPTSKAGIDVVLSNPAIRKSIVVAVPNLVHDSFNFVVGFGVCPDTKDPKLVRITCIDDYREIESISSIPFQVMVFTLSSGEWSTSSYINLPRKSIQFSCSHTVIGQFIYWLAHDRTGENHGFGFHNLIMSFDLSTEEFREVDLPDSLADSLAELPESDLSVYRLRESLSVIKYRYVWYGRYLLKGVCDVWMMEDGDSKAFKKLFTVDIPNASISRTLGFTKSGVPIVEIEDDDKDFDTRCTLVVYDPCSEHLKDLGICGSSHSFSASSYTESLLLLDHDDGHIIRCGSCEEVTFGTGN